MYFIYLFMMNTLRRVGIGRGAETHYFLYIGAIRNLYCNVLRKYEANMHVVLRV